MPAAECTVDTGDAGKPVECREPVGHYVVEAVVHPQPVGVEGDTGTNGNTGVRVEGFGDEG